MRCDQCRFWHDTEGDEEDAGMRACHGVREARNITEGLPDSEKPAALRASRAYVMDADEFGASFVTAPDFFCALFQAH
jgi:hypothetical protein